MLDERAADRLPTAATCMNLLKLPPYRSAQQVRSRSGEGGGDCIVMCCRAAWGRHFQHESLLDAVDEACLVKPYHSHPPLPPRCATSFYMPSTAAPALSSAEASAWRCAARHWTLHVLPAQGLVAAAAFCTTCLVCSYHSKHLLGGGSCFVHNAPCLLIPLQTFTLCRD